MTFKVKLNLTKQPEGGFTVTCSDLPELITEGDTFDEAVANAREAFVTVVELYAEQGRDLPPSIFPK